MQQLHNNMRMRFNRGFTLFVAVVTTSVLLAIGISILNITLKEFILSSLTRDSEAAFYAADAGMECALYHDIVGGAFPAAPGGGGFSISCMDDSSVSVDENSGTYTFEASWGNPEICARVEVVKQMCSGFPCTTIESRGHNRGCGEIANPRTVERGLRVRY